MGQEIAHQVDGTVRPLLLKERTLQAVADYINSGKVSRGICVLTGAGISTAAGIPDFRSPGTGLYENLERLDLPYPEAVFDLSYFKQHPEPFYVLATLIEKKGLLRKLFTQNIDCLERRAGVSLDKIVEAHGSFATQHCTSCRSIYPDDMMKKHVQNGSVPRCQNCEGLIKPDIVFFGENLPQRFHDSVWEAGLADVMLVIGTSLSVYPFANLPEKALEGRPRILLNRERVGQLGSRPDDVLELGDCDVGIRKLARALGWGEELQQYWKGLVGNAEAERQMRSWGKLEENITKGDVDDLADGIEAKLDIVDHQNGTQGVSSTHPSKTEPLQNATTAGEERKQSLIEDRSSAPATDQDGEQLPLGIVSKETTIEAIGKEKTKDPSRENLEGAASQQVAERARMLNETGIYGSEQ